MRLEERQIDGHEFEQDRQREKSPLEEKRTDDLQGIGGDEMRSTGQERHQHLLGVMRAILEDRHVNMVELGLSQREQRALEAIQVAVTGRSADTHQFVYAEDRRTMLEQALAILQPDLISHDAAMVSELQTELSDLTAKVGDLRDQLLNLEEGQDDLVSAPREVTKTKDGETDDKPTDTDGEKKSTLYGPERKDAAKPATTLTGAEVKAEKRETTLTGPERKQATPQASSLGDADEIAEAAKKKPWWRRVIGG